MALTDYGDAFIINPEKRAGELQEEYNDIVKRSKIMDEKQSINSEEDGSLEETLGASDPLLQPETESPDQPDRVPNFKEDCQFVRGILEANKKTVKALMNHDDFKNEQTHEDQHSEMKANIMLCYRNLEDARMRMGKAIQAYDGGKSCYPK